MQERKTCMFAGHRKIPFSMEEETRRTIRRLIVEDGMLEFLCGGMGEFDALCARIVRELKAEFPQIRLVLVLASMSASAMHMDWAQSYYDKTVIADASDGAYYKRAITLRNRWMAEQSHAVIAHLRRDHGGAYATVRYAAKRKKPLHFICSNPQIVQGLLSLNQALTARK